MYLIESIAGFLYIPTKSQEKPAPQSRFSTLAVNTAVVERSIQGLLTLVIIWMFSEVSEFAIYDNL